MAGVTTDVCLVYPAISACREGYQVQAVMDASGSPYDISEEMSRRRMEREGVVLTATNTLMAELAQDWSRPEGGQLLGILFQEVLPRIADGSAAEPDAAPRPYPGFARITPSEQPGRWSWVVRFRLLWRPYMTGQQASRHHSEERNTLKMWRRPVGRIMMLTLSLLAAPLAAKRSRRARSTGSATWRRFSPPRPPVGGAPLDGLRERGYSEGQNLVFDAGYSEGTGALRGFRRRGGPAPGRFASSRSRRLLRLLSSTRPRRSPSS